MDKKEEEEGAREEERAAAMTMATMIITLIPPISLVMAAAAAAAAAAVGSVWVVVRYRACCDMINRSLCTWLITLTLLTCPPPAAVEGRRHRE